MPSPSVDPRGLAAARRLVADAIASRRGMRRCRRLCLRPTPPQPWRPSVRRLHVPGGRHRRGRPVLHLSYASYGAADEATFSILAADADGFTGWFVMDLDHFRVLDSMAPRTGTNYLPHDATTREFLTRR